MIPVETETKPSPAVNNTPAKAEPANVASRVLQQVQKLMETKTLFLPADYSVENALRSAWFSIQNSDQKDKILACTIESQANALYDMAIQALDIGKKQGYMIPYGNRLVFQRSYFGDEAVAKRVRPGIEVYTDVIYQGEKVTVRKDVTKYGYVTTVIHEPAFPRQSTEIVGAYCGVFDENGVHMGAELMSMEQIRTSWKKSKTYGPNSATFHNEQPDQACKRTVSRRRLKPIINASDDSALLESIRRQDMDAVEAEFDEEVSANANGDILGAAPSLEAPAAPSNAETPPAEQVLDSGQLIKELKLSEEQVTQLSQALILKIDQPLVIFLRAAVADGCKDFKGLEARIQAMPDQPALTGGPGY